MPIPIPKRQMKHIDCKQILRRHLPARRKMAGMRKTSCISPGSGMRFHISLPHAGFGDMGVDLRG